MRRRLLFALLAAPAFAGAQEGSPRPSHKVSAAQLYKALSARFPMSWRARGLVELRVDATRLLLLPERQQLGATLAVEASGAQLEGVEGGEVDLVFALRYEPSDRTLRAHRPDILEVRWARMPERTARVIRQLLREALRESFGEVTLHRFTARDLALADTMGFAPETITVVDDGIVVQFARKSGSDSN